MFLGRHPRLYDRKWILIQLRLDVSAVQEVVVRLGVPSAKLRGGRVPESRRVGGPLRTRLPTQPELQLRFVLTWSIRLCGRESSLYYK